MNLAGTSHKFNVVVNRYSLREYIHPENSYTYVEGREGSNFSLEFVNNSSNRVLIIPSVDGLSVMDGKPASADSEGYVVYPWQALKIPGWRIDNTKVGAFKFLSQGTNKTYAEELSNAGFNIDPANQGVIGILVFDEEVIPQYQGLYQTNDWAQTSWIARGAPPISMTMTASACSGNHNLNAIPMNASLGVGFGKDKSFHTTNVYFNKKGHYTTSGTIYYDTLINLRKKGVLVPAYNLPHQPNPFPGMNPNGCYVPRKRA